MRNFAFDKTNYVLLAIGMVIILVGFFLMSGSGSSETTFNPEIFSDRRIKVAPLVCLFGFLFMTYGIMHKPKSVQEEANTTNEEKETEV